VISRIKALGVAWGNGLLPPGPLRDRAVAFAKRSGFAFAPPTRSVPEPLRRRQRHFDKSQEEEFRAVLEREYFGSMADQFGPPEVYLSSDVGRADLRGHLSESIERIRMTTIPWLDSIRPLDGLRVLEIGASAGSHTLALAEQGASILAVDVNEHFLEANAARCKIAGVSNVEFVASNAEALGTIAPGRGFDMILFSASLEHMTLAERHTALTAAWGRLEPGGLLAVLEAPNRLWFLDDHTAMTPFFQWLPDELALRYASRTPRANFNTLFIENPDPITFARWGRGVSFHEFVLALEIEPSELPVASCLHEYLHDPRWKVRGRDKNYLRFCHRLTPEIPRGFFYPYLDLVLAKPAAGVPAPSPRAAPGRAR
jgi:S-adenosylmethionine-dependent methyltransferase